MRNLPQQSYEPALTYPGQRTQPYLQASSGGLQHPPSESGFSMARANQRLNAQAASSGEPSTAAETLNNTGHARKSVLGSQITTEASQMNNCADQQAAFARSNREALQAAHFENSMMTPSSCPKRGKRQGQDTATASTMHNTLQAQDLKLKLIKPKQHKNAVSKVDSGLKNKKRSQHIDPFGNVPGYHVLEVAHSERRAVAAASNTASAKSQRKRPDWSDYFLQRSERNGVDGQQQRAAIVKDIDSF